jgi:hypothetical protein
MEYSVMKFHLSLVAISTLLLSPFIASVVHAGTPLQQGRSTQSFIVLCDCATHAQRTRIQHAIKSAGGKVFYTYENLGGFAVEASPSVEPAQLEQTLRRIPGVRSIEPDGEAHTSSQNRVEKP